MAGHCTASFFGGVGNPYSDSFHSSKYTVNINLQLTPIPVKDFQSQNINEYINSGHNVNPKQNVK